LVEGTFQIGLKQLGEPNNEKKNVKLDGGAHNLRKSLGKTNKEPESDLGFWNHINRGGKMHRMSLRRTKVSKARVKKLKNNEN